MLCELVGEFKGRNAGWRVLPEGRIEVTAQGTGKILGKDALVLITSVGSMANGVFMGEVTSVFTTMEGENVMAKGISVGFPFGNGGTTRVTSIHTTQSKNLARLKKVVGLHEYDSDMQDNWTGKIWEWK